jgi:hypothetical protein
VPSHRPHRPHRIQRILGLTGQACAVAPVSVVLVGCAQQPRCMQHCSTASLHCAAGSLRHARAVLSVQLKPHLAALHGHTVVPHIRLGDVLPAGNATPPLARFLVCSLVRLFACLLVCLFACLLICLFAYLLVCLFAAHHLFAEDAIAIASTVQARQIIYVGLAGWLVVPSMRPIGPSLCRRSRSWETSSRSSAPTCSASR